MKKTLIVIDMQNDFITGSLGTKEATQIIPRVKEKIKTYIENKDEIIFTRDSHKDTYLESQEGRNLPVEHCIKGTRGWEIGPGIYVEGCEIIDKDGFGYTGWGSHQFEELELVGLCTDICVVTNALILKTIFPEIKIKVDEACCAGVTPASHQAAIGTMKMCQIEII